MLSSFPQAHRASEQLLEIKRIERLTERIGGERVLQRDAETAAFEALPLMQKLAAPAGVKPPELAAVLPDGGRLQLCEPNEDSKTHWHEYKAGCLKGMSSKTFEEDPCSDVPPIFLQRERIERLTAEIGKKAAEMPPEAASTPSPIAMDPPEVPGNDESYEPHRIDRETAQPPRPFTKATIPAIGTEKFWSEAGAEALLQLKADTLSDTGHWQNFWRTRPRTMTGTRHYAGSKT